MFAAWTMLHGEEDYSTAMRCEVIRAIMLEDSLCLLCRL